MSTYTIRLWLFLTNAVNLMLSWNENTIHLTCPLVTGEFPSQRPVTQSFDVFFHLRLNKRLSKKSWVWWFETPSCSLWRHCNVTVTPWWARWRLKSPASPILVQLFAQAQIKKTSNSASLAFVRGIHRLPVNSPYKGPGTRKIFPFDDVIIWT